MILFKYKPMWGVIIAFKNYKELLGISESKWVGLYYFKLFLESPDAFKLIRNTLLDYKKDMPNFSKWRKENMGKILGFLAADGNV